MRDLRRMFARPLIVVAASAAALTGCAQDRVTDADRLLTAVRATSRAGFQLRYDEVVGEDATGVAVTYVDDLRYQARVHVGGVLAYEEVAYDEALAARAATPTAFAILGRSAAAPARTSPALRDGRWVLDQLGAPDRLAGSASSSRRALGSDPILDALSVFDYVRRVRGESLRVHVLDTDALDYRPDEDPFPLPDRAAGEIRYDFDPTPLPARRSATSRVDTPLRPANFRRFAVYVRDGRVVRVREAFDIASRLAELATRFEIRTDASDLVPHRVADALRQINASLASVGIEPIRPRTLTVEVALLPASARIELPRGAEVASLRALRNRGSATGRIPTIP